MLINPEAMVIITSNASPGEKGWARAEDRIGENPKENLMESLAACWKHSKDA